MSGKFTMERRSDDSYDIMVDGQIVVQAIDANNQSDAVFGFWTALLPAADEPEDEYDIRPADAYLEGVVHGMLWFREA